MSDPGFRDHFSGAAAGYAAFRPTYPRQLFDFVVGLTGGRALAWDAGTGSGQAAAALVPHFAHVVATDASIEQIRNAKAHERITYRVAPAEASGLERGSCDLVTVAQALHWFDIPAFFTEARRVLKPGGAIAVWGYAEPSLEDPACDAVFQEYVKEVDAYWPTERVLVNSRYATIYFPFDEVAAPVMQLTLNATPAECMGYMRTWSSSMRYATATGKDRIADVAARLAPLWPHDKRLELRWPLFVRAGHT